MSQDYCVWMNLHTSLTTYAPNLQHYHIIYFYFLKRRRKERSNRWPWVLPNLIISRARCKAGFFAADVIASFMLMGLTVLLIDTSALSPSSITFWSLILLVFCTCSLGFFDEFANGGFVEAIGVDWSTYIKEREISFYLLYISTSIYIYGFFKCIYIYLWLFRTKCLSNWGVFNWSIDSKLETTFDL